MLVKNFLLIKEKEHAKNNPDLLKKKRIDKQGLLSRLHIYLKKLY